MKLGVESTVAMARSTFWLSLAALFLASVIPSEAQKTEAATAAGATAAGATGEAGEESVVTVALGAPLTVECRLRAEQPAAWQRDGAAPPPDLRAAPEAAAAPDARLAARLRAPHARAHHAGLYTCASDRRHRVRVVVLPAEPGAEPAAAASAAPAAGAEAGDEPPEVLYDVRSNFTLLCTLPNDKNLEYVWRKNETELAQVWELRDRFTLERGGAEFRVARALEDDFGNYSCALAGAAGERRWAVRGRPHLKLPANTNVVEGQKLKLTCKVIGKPYARVQWAYSNSSDGPFAPLDATAALADSEAGVPDGVLLLAAAERRHAGRYRCDAPHALLPAVTVLRVKDMYAALWPFLGICAEVFVLCAIILLYERRRTKPDLDDSDTDNHDQKKS